MFDLIYINNMPQYPSVLVIDTRQRTSGTAEAGSMQLTPSIAHWKSAELLSVVMPLTTFNVNTSNNQIRFYGNALPPVNIVASIPPGNYTAQTFASILQSILLANGILGATVIYNPTSLRWLFTATNPFWFNFVPPLPNSAESILGMPGLLVGGSTSFSSTYAINMGLPLYFMIQIPELGLHVYSKNGQATFVVNNYVINQGTLSWTMLAGYQMIECSHTQTFHEINWRIYGDNGELLDLQGNDLVIMIGFKYSLDKIGYN